MNPESANLGTYKPHDTRDNFSTEILDQPVMLVCVSMGARSRARTRRALCTIAERRSSTPLSFADVQLALPRSVHSTVHYDQNFQNLSMRGTIGGAADYYIGVLHLKVSI